MTRPVVEFDDNREVVTINGTPYTYDFFAQLGVSGAPVGSVFRVDERDGGGDVILRRPFTRQEMMRWADELQLVNEPEDPPKPRGTEERL